MCTCAEQWDDGASIVLGLMRVRVSMDDYTSSLGPKWDLHIVEQDEQVPNDG